MIHGHNLLIEIDGKIDKHGFYTPRFIEAYTEDSAKELAREEFITEQKWKDLQTVLKNVKDDPPQLEIEEIKELPSFDGIENRRPGYAFY